MKLLDVIIKLVDPYVNDLSLIKAGVNGPYNHKETLARNYSHWIVTFSKLFHYTDDIKYFKAIEKLSTKLISSHFRPNGYSFYCRNVTGKDSCNGLIGQAWVFEALYVCYKTLKDDKFQRLAEDVFNQHKFNHENGLWSTLDIDGKSIEIDAAFNHQLWFAYAAAKIIPKSNSNFKNINIFLDKIKFNLKLIENGLVYHPIEKYALANLLRKNESIKNKLKRNIKLILKNKTLGHLFVNKHDLINNWEKVQIIKSYGYHAFNMFAFVKLEKLTHNHDFWKTNSYQSMINILFNDDFLLKNDNNKYSYPYNPTGFEIAYVANEKIENEKEKNEKISFFVNKQFELNFNMSKFLFSNNNNDVNTLTARLYELVSIPLSALSKIEIKTPSNEC